MLEPILDALRVGRPLADAVVAQARAQVERGQAHIASSIATSLRAQPGTEQVGLLTGAVVAFRRGYVDLAWSLFEQAPRALWASYAAEEYVRAGLHGNPDRALAQLRELVREQPGSTSAQSWMDMLGPVFGHGDEALASDIYAIVDRMVGDGDAVEQSLVVNRDWMRRWVARSADSPSAPALPAGRTPFAIMDYGHPGRSRASANIGDHVQSLASLGHLARHQDLEFSGPQDLVDLLQQLHGRVRPDMERRGVDAGVELLTVDRDASMWSEIPPNTWTLAFGWYMHAIFEMRYGFPFHRNLLPIFVSFHCNKRDLLTSEAIGYLRRFGPIGCRDWTTVDILLSVDVPAFFSGCMTTTVSNVFPDLPERPDASAPVAYVDIPEADVPASAPKYKHSDDAVRFRTFATNVYDAVDLLETYRREHSGLVTSRLHCYLPGRSIGVPVDFLPKNRSDIRFAGLIDITDVEFDRIRDGINVKLETVLAAAFAGGSPDAVYQLWREVNADDVAVARKRHTASSAMPPIRSDIEAQVSAVVDAAPKPAVGADSIHVVVHVAKGQTERLAVLLASIEEHTSRRVHAWMLTRAPRSVDLERLKAAAPGIDVSMISTHGLGADLQRGDERKTSPRDIDLLALGELLPGVDRVLVLPVAALVTEDIASLFDTDLGGDLLAAPTVVGTRAASGFGILNAAASRLASRTVAAADLRRRGHARHVFDFDAFDTDVLVVDLAASRARSLLTSYVPFIEEFGLTFREILLFEVGPHRAVVPERWHVVPTRSAVRDPALIHWADGGKPWADGVVEEQERWLAAAARIRT